MASASRVSASPRRPDTRDHRRPCRLRTGPPAHQRRVIIGGGAHPRKPAPHRHVVALRGSGSASRTATARPISWFDALSRRSTATGSLVSRQVSSTGSRSARSMDGVRCHPSRPRSSGIQAAGDAGLPPQSHQLAEVARRAQALEPLVAHPLGGELGQAIRSRRAPRPTWRGRSRTPAAPRSGGRGGCGGSPRGSAAPGRRRRAPRRRSRSSAPPKGSRHSLAQRMIGEGVDGEVAPGQVVLERDAVLHDRVPAVGLDVLAEGRHLVQQPLPVEHAHRAEPEPDRHGTRKEPQDLLRPRRGGDVEVHLGIAEQGVPHRAADAPRLEARALEHAGDVQHLLGNRDPASCRQPRCVRHAAPRGRWSAPSAPATACGAGGHRAHRHGARAATLERVHRRHLARWHTGWPARPAFRRQPAPDGGHRAGRQVAAAERLDHHAVVRVARRVEQLALVADHHRTSWRRAPRGRAACTHGGPRRRRPRR